VVDTFLLQSGSGKQGIAPLLEAASLSRDHCTTFIDMMVRIRMACLDVDHIKNSNRPLQKGASFELTRTELVNGEGWTKRHAGVRK